MVHVLTRLHVYWIDECVKHVFCGEYIIHLEISGIRNARGAKYYFLSYNKYKVKLDSSTKSMYYIKVMLLFVRITEKKR